MALLKSNLLILLTALLLCAEKGKDVTISFPNSGPSSTTTNSTDTSEAAHNSGHLTLEQESQNHKSVWGTSLLNLAVPGTGHFYLGDTRKGTAYLSADLVLWTGFFFAMVTSGRHETSAVSHAYTYAHTLSSFEYSNSYWGALGNDNFLTSEEYNTALENNRLFGTKYLGDNAWSWDTKEKQEEYNEIRSDAQAWETASYIVLGALFLNRVVAFIDGRVSAQRFNNAQMKITPTYTMDMTTSNPTFGAVFRMSF